MPPPTEAPPVQLYTVEEAAAMLKIGKDFLYELARDRRVDYRRIGARGVRFSADDIQKIIEHGYRPGVQR